MSDYLHSRLRELQKALLLSPQPVRRRHADRIEALVTSLEPEADHSYEFVYFRVTGFRPENAPLETFPGSDLRADLILLLDRVSQSAPAPAAEAPEPVLAVGEVAKSCHVSPRTVYRWRHKGLVCRRYVFPDGGTRIGVRKGALHEFIGANREFVERSRRFARLSDAEREQILAQARELAGEGELSRTAAAERIGRATGRAKETVRRALTAEELADPRHPGFGGVKGRLAADQKMQVYRAYRSGQSVATLSARFGRSRSSIHRLVNEARARELLADGAAPGLFITDGEFSLDGADDAILGPARPGVGRVERYRGDLPLAGGLDARQEKALFRRYNYLRYRATGLKARIRPERYVPTGLLDDIEALLTAAKQIRQRLVEAHTPRVWDVAKKHAGALVGLDDLVSEGMLVLGEAIDTFDYRGRGGFSSYARWALMRSFARTVPAEH